MAATLKLAPHADPVADVDAPDEQLIRRSLGGDAEAFARLYDRYQTVVFITCIRQLRNQEQAEDAVQDTFLRAFTSLDTFLPGRKFLPWLLSIAVRRCIDLKRRGSHWTSVDPTDDEWTQHAGGDTTMAAVLSAEDRRHLERALSTLPRRHQRVLLLRAVEGWSYEDIASVEGLSVSGTKSMLCRAREGLRTACRSAAFGLVVFPMRRLRTQVQHVNARYRTSNIGEPAIATSLQVISAVFTLVAVTVLQPTSTPTFNGVAGGDHVATSPDSSRSTSPLNERTHTTHHNRDGQFSVTQTASSLKKSALDPTGGATPERTRFSSIVPSPHYGMDGDRTVFGAGTVRCVRETLCSVLFKSDDGGTTWNKLVAEDFAGRQLLLPPSYPADSRIFAMGPSGLQESKDGGASFLARNPLVGAAAISPAFETDPRILIGGTSVMEYWADRTLMKPAPLLAASVSQGTTVAFSPAYPQQEVILVGGLGPDMSGAVRTQIRRCDGSVCTDARINDTRSVPSLRLSPKFALDATVYAFTDTTVSRSDDGGTSFRRVDLPWRGVLSDVVFSGAAGQTLIAGVVGDAGLGGVYRSSDRGASWTRSSVDVSHFGSGVRSLAVTATGRLFAASESRGVACSDDGGLNWSVRCL